MDIPCLLTRTDGRLVPPPPIPKAREEEEVNEANRGSLAPQAASILMKLLYAARVCRFDLLRSINNLARKITKWTKKEDALLHHLMAYVHQSKHHMMIGWVGDSLGSETRPSDSDCLRMRTMPAVERA